MNLLNHYAQIIAGLWSNFGGAYNASEASTSAHCGRGGGRVGGASPYHGVKKIKKVRL